MGNFVKVATVGEIGPGQAKLIEVNGKRIALFNLEGVFYAIDDYCTHEGGPLSEGFLDGDEVTCPWHSATFNIKTGEALSPPAEEGVSTYPVRVSGNDLEIEI